MTDDLPLLSYILHIRPKVCNSCGHRWNDSQLFSCHAAPAAPAGIELRPILDTLSPLRGVPFGKSTLQQIRVRVCDRCIDTPAFQAADTRPPETVRHDRTTRWNLVLAKKQRELDAAASAAKKKGGASPTSDEDLLSSFD